MHVLARSVDSVGRDLRTSGAGHSFLYTSTCSTEPACTTVPAHIDKLALFP
jgi:hypothetical protein